jgi:hypothetical protein
MALSRTQVSKWLKLVGYSVSPGAAPDAKYSLDVTLPNQLKVTLIVPVGDLATLGIGAGLIIPEEDRKLLRKTREEFDWTLRSGLLQLGLGFNITIPVTGEAASLVQLQYALFEPTISRTQVMDGIQKVVNGLVYTIITINRFKSSAAKGQTGRSQRH